MDIFIQWKVYTPTAKGYKMKTYDNYKSAKIDYGKACKLAALEKKATLLGRYSYIDNWIILQEQSYDI